MSQTAAVESGFRVAIPPEWAAELGMQDAVTLEKTPAGILIRPVAESSPRSWDAFFASKLPVSAARGADTPGADVTLEVRDSDYLF